MINFTGPLGLSAGELSERMAPHLARLALSEMFMDMEVRWGGADARDLHDLLSDMCAWIDGPATDQIARLSARKKALTGAKPGPTADQIRKSNCGGFTGTFGGILKLLEGGAQPDRCCLFTGPGVAALRELIRDITGRCTTDIPGRIAALSGEVAILEALNSDVETYRP